MMKKDKFVMPQEKIDIAIPVIPKSHKNPRIKDEEIYFERVNYVSNGHSLHDLPDLKAKVEQITESLQGFLGKSEALLHQFHFLKMFSRARFKNPEVSDRIYEFEKQIARMKRIYEDLKNKGDLYRYMEKVEDQDLEETFGKINDLFDFLREISKDLTQFQNKFFKKLKMTSYSICNDKSYPELETLNRNISQTMEGYKSFQEAHDYIFYNSGELIVNTIKALVHCLASKKNLNYAKTYNYSYFLGSEVVVALKFTEWIELFNKIRFVMRTTSGVELFDYLIFKNYYLELEKRYIMMLIYDESENI